MDWFPRAPAIPGLYHPLGSPSSSIWSLCRCCSPLPEEDDMVCILGVVGCLGGRATLGQLALPGLMGAKEGRGESVLLSRRVWKVDWGKRGTPSHEGGCPYMEDAKGREEVLACDVKGENGIPKGKWEKPQG